MKAANADADSFEILSDEGQMIGNANVFDRKRLEVNDIQTFGDQYRPDIVERMRVFAEGEARRLGLLDE